MERANGWPWSWFLAFAFALALLPSCDQSTGPGSGDSPPLPALTIPWTDSNSVVCFGTSLTYGFRWQGIVILPPPAAMSPGSPGEANDYIKDYRARLSSLAFDVDSSYPGFLQNRLKIRVFNQGYVGATIARGLQLVHDSVLGKRPVLVLLEFGANDFLQDVSVDTAEARLDRLVGQILSSRCVVVLVSFFNPDMLNRVSPNYPLLAKKDLALAYFAMLQRVAQTHSIEMVDYPLKDIFGDSRYMSDLIHPNAIGYLKMEQNISQALMLTWKRNGMLRLP